MKRLLIVFAIWALSMALWSHAATVRTSVCPDIPYDSVAYINKAGESKLEFKVKVPGKVAVEDLIKYIGLLQQENERLWNINIGKKG